MSAAPTGCLLLPAPPPYEVWRIDLTAPLPSDAADALSPHERARAQRFAFDVHRRRYVCAHWALRSLLAERADAPMAALEFGFGPHGKPYLRAPHAWLAFNLSDSEDVALVTVLDTSALQTEIGIDVERLRAVPDADELAKTHFTTDERAELACSRAPAARDRRFLNGWTRKEACLKAIGSGLSIDAHTFDAGLDEAPRRVGIPVGSAIEWVEVQSIAVGADCVAAVARRVDAA